MKLFTRAEKAFIDALYTLLQNEHINRVHVTEILELSGYTKGAFYGRFENKYDFVEKLIEKTRKMHNYFLDRCGNMMWQGKEVYDPESMKNSEDFFKFVYDYHKLYDMIIDRKLRQDSLELFLFGADSPYPLVSPAKIADIDMAEEMMNTYFGYYNSIVYIMLWRSIGYDNISPENMSRLILPVQKSVHNHFLDNKLMDVYHKAQESKR